MINNISFNGKWSENYIEKKLKLVDERNKRDIVNKFRKYGYVQSVMKYINHTTLTMAFHTCSKVVNNNNEIFNKEKTKGVDEISKEEYEKNLYNNIEVLYQQLRNKSYDAQMVKRININQTKVKNGEICFKVRPLSIISVNDLVLQTAIVNQILEPITEEIFTNESFAYREGIGVRNAIDYTSKLILDGNNNVISLDIKGYFDNIKHNKLINMIKEIIKDKTFIKIIKILIKVNYIDKHKEKTMKKGLCQGSVIAPVLANLYLHVIIDNWYKKIKTKGQIHISRYADDILIILNKKEDIDKVYKEIIKRFKKYGLEISKDKTKIINTKEENIKYLGYTLQENNGCIEKYIPDDKIIIKMFEINEIIKQSIENRNSEVIRKKLNKAYYKGYYYKDRNIKEMKDSLLGLYLQGYIKCINNKLNGLYKYYEECKNVKELKEIYSYAYNIFKETWINKIDKQDLMYILSNIVSFEDYLMYKCISIEKLGEIRL